ncbi:unnamed protein product [Durusdinium trenchii]|uniref:Uncharacterized protein n=1 Tax=Durusdinium trenchii TaxID=1381693 RepID=A0ABP0LDD7_9DINO
MTSSSSSDSSDEEEKKKEDGSGSDSDSDDTSESSSDKKKKKKAKKEKKKKKKDKKDKKAKKKKGDKKAKKKKDKKKKKKKGDDTTEAMRGSVSNQFGKYGIIKAEDFFNKKAEFMLWAQEEYVEDYNTATMPSKKYYNIRVFEQQVANKRRKKKAESVIDTALQSSLASFDDEKARRDEVLALRAKKQESQISSEVQRLRMNKDKAEEMKHQAVLKTQAAMLNKAGQVEAAGKINQRLDPNKVDWAERRAKRMDGPVGFQPES